MGEFQGEDAARRGRALACSSGRPCRCHLGALARDSRVQAQRSTLHRCRWRRWSSASGCSWCRPAADRLRLAVEAGGTLPATAHEDSRVARATARRSLARYAVPSLDRGRPCEGLIRRPSPSPKPAARTRRTTPARGPHAGERAQGEARPALKVRGGATSPRSRRPAAASLDWSDPLLAADGRRTRGGGSVSAWGAAWVRRGCPTGSPNAR